MLNYYADELPLLRNMKTNILHSDKLSIHAKFVNGSNNEFCFIVKACNAIQVCKGEKFIRDFEFRVSIEELQQLIESNPVQSHIPSRILEECPSPVSEGSILPSYQEALGSKG